MLNEIELVKSIISDGVSDKEFVYRSLYMLAQYYLFEKHMTKEQSYQQILFWAGENNLLEFTDKYNLNSIVDRVFEKREKLRGDFEVHLNKKDITEIATRFSANRTRLIALVMLCLDKIYHGDKFECPAAEMAYWLKMQRTHITGRHIKELVDYNYITVENKVEYDVFGRPTGGHKNNTYQLTCHTHNQGNIIVNSNNIQSLTNIVSSMNQYRYEWIKEKATKNIQ